ncbi:hypothetical protein ARAM_000791 [Aspergillus rambellii]|uniref:C2H2-type domain-containing protein n=1 Tax=Aspergillus rambellii TaxID=308745 RepID=A0A0F8UU49_9EURO|nr:hypothetical protein ARAM_000791 [Aspergillus rambellii]
MAHTSPHRKVASSSKRFRCSKCTKSYTKLEHLNRHERTHSNSKPYCCEKCGRSFGRQDVLSRHAKLHLNPQDRLGASALQTPQESSLTIQDELHHLVSTTSPTIPYTTGVIPTPATNVGAHGSLQESDNLLDWLLAGFNETPIVPLPLTDLSALTTQTTQTALTANSGLLFDYNQGLGNRRPETMGIQQLFKLINDLSKRLSSDIDNTGITSDFLDACLYEFFKRVSPSFPIIHEPTFSSQKSIPPLLLNMVALGSLYVCQPNSVQKGELLWRLGHTAVATSWQTLITMRGPHDKCDGVQLVLTALLGQKYALLSSNTDIRTTAFVFHGLGFYWARTCGMYLVREFPQASVPSVDSPESEKGLLWEIWAASEMQRRAVLGHYILDGLISQASGSPPSARHLINKIGAACSDAAFAATSVDDWILEMSRSNKIHHPMPEVFSCVFNAQYPLSPLDISIFTISVVIEGVQSLISEAQEVEDSSFGVVTRQQIIRALLNLHQANIYPLVSPGASNNSDLLIRWHTVCMEVAVPTMPVYRAICDIFDVPQMLGGIPATTSALRFDLEGWVKSADAIRALLHARSVVNLLNDLPLTHAHAPHLPTAIFSSAVVICGVCLFGSSMIELPRTPRWEDVWESPLSTEQFHHEAGQSPVDGYSGAYNLLHALRSSTGEGFPAINLLSDMNFLQLALNTITSRWGVSLQMEKIISHLTILAREHHTTAM